MNVHVAPMTVVLYMVAVAAFAAEPSAPSASPQAATSTAAPASSLAAAPQAPTTAKEGQAPAAGASAQAPIGPAMATALDAATLAKSAHELGYTKRVRDNKAVYYCKADASLGTRLVSTKCYTEDQMSAVVERTAANRQTVQEFELKRLTEPPKQ